MYKLSCAFILSHTLSLLQAKLCLSDEVVINLVSVHVNEIT